MSSSPLLNKLKEDMKDAMRSKEKERLLAIRLILAAVKQKEVDERVELTDQDVIALVDKQIKQRRESIKQYVQAERNDLAEVEQKEIDLMKVYLPEQLTAEELDALINDTIEKSGAENMKDMGKVMGALKPLVQGRTDMTAVSELIKARLS